MALAVSPFRHADHGDATVDRTAVDVVDDAAVDAGVPVTLDDDDRLGTGSGGERPR
jgi:hypothetical protein